MARARMIHPEIWTDEAFMAVGMVAQKLFLGMISLADDDGRLSGHPLFLNAKLFVNDGLEAEAILAARDGLEKVGLIFVYDASGKQYVQIRSWYVYQKIRFPVPSLLPEPPPEILEQLPRPKPASGRVRRSSSQAATSEATKDSAATPRGTSPDARETSSSRGAAQRNVDDHQRNAEQVKLSQEKLKPPPSPSPSPPVAAPAPGVRSVVVAALSKFWKGRRREQLADQVLAAQVPDPPAALERLFGEAAAGGLGDPAAWIAAAIADHDLDRKAPAAARKAAAAAEATAAADEKRRLDRERAQAADERRRRIAAELRRLVPSDAVVRIRGGPPEPTRLAGDRLQVRARIEGREVWGDFARELEQVLGDCPPDEVPRRVAEAVHVAPQPVGGAA